MLNERILTALNNQINAELFSSYLYLSMSTYFQTINLEGFANWMQVQAQEELTHAMKFYNFVHKRGNQVTLRAIPEPPHQWNSPLHPFEDAYTHEQKITFMINDLIGLAVQEKDYATNSFLQWFVNEQVEEEESASNIVQQIRQVGNKSSELFLLNRELGQRVFVPSQPNSEGANI